MAEGEIPTGWTRQNFTSGSTGNFDLLIPFRHLFGLGCDFGDTVQAGQLGCGAPPPTRRELCEWQTGDPVGSGEICHAESDNRGGSQVQYLSQGFRPEWQGEHLPAYNSIYEQNQDSLGAVEYSIDGGKTWLPVVYMLDGPTLSGILKAMWTRWRLSTPPTPTRRPIPIRIPEKTQEANMATLLVPPSRRTWFRIFPRVNDDPIESKRVEFYPLPAAANQKTVRLRFAQAGTGSWYFGVDNVGLYSITVVDPEDQCPAGRRVRV